jgi:signal transduction histidine kinase/iron only hydrogenase large subunit-like protein
MTRPATVPLVSTIPERCRVCYTCVRECPAKAIRIAGWQAEVIPERCIGCGNCVRVCSQGAKRVASSVGAVDALLASGEPVAACVAPSFPAEFRDMAPGQLAGLLRAMGFSYVHEVAFGADLVAAAYKRLVQENPKGYFISTTCPAIVGYVERYHPNLVENLAPLASPMEATAKVVKSLHGDGTRIVFIGPCVAKKEEASTGSGGFVDEALTFVELREMLKARALASGLVPSSDFDPPHGGLGALFPLSRGMLQAADIREDLLASDVVAADGRSSFVEVIKEFESEDLNAHLLEVLCCNGCIMGSGMTCEAPLFRRRARVSQYVRARIDALDRDRWLGDVERFSDLDLSRSFCAKDQRAAEPSEETLREIMAKMGKTHPEDELNCGACGYDTCLEHAVAIHRGLAESEMCLPHTIEQLRSTVAALAQTNDRLENTQQALMHSERLASMGQLAAGIAHEVNNPLGVVLLYAHTLLEEAPADADLRADLGTIVSEADRCKKIVSGLLNFARQNKVLLHETDLCLLVEQALKTLPPPEGVTVSVENDSPSVLAELDRDQIVQVLSNLVRNAMEAMAGGGTVTVRTGAQNGSVFLSVEDTGTGIRAEDLNKIYTPFFTTKPIGKGTGLGLPVTYGIVKMHRGDIQVRTNADPAKGPTGTTFTVTLPRQGTRE